jgi:hypothetical protein
MRATPEVTGGLGTRVLAAVAAMAACHGAHVAGTEATRAEVNAGSGVAEAERAERGQGAALAEASGPGEPVSLVLQRVLPLTLEGDVEREFQPSGLLLWQGHLLTVSDKHDRAIDVIDLAAVPAAGNVPAADSVNTRPFVRFEPPADESPPFDYEGLSPAPGGGWLVTSEAHSRVLHVELDPIAPSTLPAAGRARWLTPSLRGVGGGGCLQVPNAGLEGVTLLDTGQILLAGEREPRCLILLDPSGDRASAEVWSMQQSAYPFEPGRSPDYSDLTLSGQRLYALSRNAYLIVRLERTPHGFREGRAFSYRHAEDDPRYRYQDRKFGMAEGVAVGEHEVFVVLDNNGKARAADGADRRPLLFVFERPPEL